MSRTFRRTTVPHELSFCGDPRVERGHIQMEIPVVEFLNGMANLPETENYKKGYKILPTTEENFKSVIPNTPKGKAADFRLVCMMQLKGKNENGEPQIWRRAALINKKTGGLTFVGSTNRPGPNYAKSHTEGWGILKSRVFAPVYFWKEVENRLKFGV